MQKRWTVTVEIVMEADTAKMAEGRVRGELLPLWDAMENGAKDCAEAINVVGIQENFDLPSVETGRPDPRFRLPAVDAGFKPCGKCGELFHLNELVKIAGVNASRSYGTCSTCRTTTR